MADGEAATAKAAAPPDDYERDTDAAQETDAMALCMQPAEGHGDAMPPQGATHFGLAFSSRVFAGWVKQSSPACAAASVAGACNALLGRSRGDADAFDQEALLAVLRGILEERMETQRYRLECCLGCDWQPLQDALRDSLRAEDLSFGMKWEGKTKRKTLSRHLRAVAEDVGRTGQSFERLRVAYKQFDEAKAADAGESAGEESSEEEGAEGSSALPASSPGAQVEDALLPAGPAPVGAGWRKHLFAYLDNLCGYEKLLRPRPSTGFFGNWGILGAVKRLAREQKLPLSARLIAGRAAKGADVAIKMSAKDTAAKMSDQWVKFRDAFMQPETALIFHLKNHYALIYALREWISSDGTHVRQLLTARRGQRPKVWIDFEEAHQTMTKWAGYKVIAVVKT